MGFQDHALSKAALQKEPRGGPTGTCQRARAGLMSLGSPGREAGWARAPRGPIAPPYPPPSFSFHQRGQPWWASTPHPRCPIPMRFGLGFAGGFAGCPLKLSGPHAAPPLALPSGAVWEHCGVPAPLRHPHVSLTLPCLFWGETEGAPLLKEDLGYTGSRPGPGELSLQRVSSRYPKRYPKPPPRGPVPSKQKETGQPSWLGAHLSLGPPRTWAAPAIPTGQPFSVFSACLPLSCAHPGCAGGRLALFQGPECRLPSCALPATARASVGTAHGSPERSLR